MSRDHIIDYARTRGLVVVRRTDAHSIVTDAAPYRVEVVVPDAVLEWQVAVADANGHEVFTDWCEHYETDSAQNVEADMAAEIVGFLSLIRPGTVRVHASSTRNEPARLEVLHDGTWTDPWDITDAPIQAVT